MSITITATEAKAKLLALIDQVADQTSGPVTITKHGKPLVMLVPVSEDKPKLDIDSFFGWAAGEVTIPDDLDLTAPTWGDDWIEARDGPEDQWLP